FSGRIDLLLTDVIMPQMNGRDLAERLVEDRPAMKVLFMSGYTDSVMMDRGILPPGVTLLGKPFTLTCLVDKVRQVLDSSEVSRARLARSQCARSARRRGSPANGWRTGPY